MKKTTKKILSGIFGLTATLSLNSCTVGGFTDEASAQKLPEPVKSMLVDLMREEKRMMERCAQGSSALSAATALIAEGCGFEKEAQVLRSHAAAYSKTSSAEDNKKHIIAGSKAVAAVNKKLSASRNVTLVSKKKFEQGYRQKIQAEQMLNQVAMREIPNALLKAAEVAKYAKGNKAGIQSNPLQAVQVGMALNYSLLPIRFVANDYKKFSEVREEFEEQCQQIGKTYNIRLPAPKKAPRIKIGNDLI